MREKSMMNAIQEFRDKTMYLDTTAHTNDVPQKQKHYWEELNKMVAMLRSFQNIN